MGWQDDARRLVIGPRHDLESFPGYYIKPKKYSVAAKDEIQAVMREIQKGIDKKALMEVMAKARELGADITQEELMKRLEPQELAALLDSTSVPSARIMEVKFRHGIAEHNFEGTTIEELAKVLTSGDIPEEIASEILSVVEGFNRPLARATSPISEMQPSGSTREAPSNTETPSPTEGTPPS